jgi:hypothetical protein
MKVGMLSSVEMTPTGGEYREDSAVQRSEDEYVHEIDG